MTYLFVVIALAVMNSVLATESDYARMLTSNGVVVAVMFVLEREWGFHFEATSGSTTTRSSWFCQIFTHWETRADAFFELATQGRAAPVRQVAQLGPAGVRAGSGASGADGGPCRRWRRPGSQTPGAGSGEGVTKLRLVATEGAFIAIRPGSSIASRFARSESLELDSRRITLVSKTSRERSRSTSAVPGRPVDSGRRSVRAWSRALTWRGMRRGSTPGVVGGAS